MLLYQVAEKARHSHADDVAGVCVLQLHVSLVLAGTRWIEQAAVFSLNTKVKKHKKEVSIIYDILNNIYSFVESIAA